MKNKSHFLACLLILAIIIFAASCGGGGGGGGSMVSFGNNSGPHNGGDAGGWGNGSYNGNGFGGNGGGIGSGDEGEIVITGSTPLNVTKYVYNGTEYSDVTALTAALRASGELPDSFNVDFYVDSESTPRTARVTANGQANNGQDIFIEHQYKALFPADGGTQEVLFYKRDGITLPGDPAGTEENGFIFETNWNIGGSLYPCGSTIGVAASGDVYFSNASPEIASYGFKEESGDYILGFRSSLTPTGTIAINTNKVIKQVQLPASGDAVLDLSNVRFKNNEIKSSSWDGTAGTVKGLILPSTVTTIGNLAFTFLFGTSLETVTIPSSVTTIEEGAFRNLSVLRTVNFSGNGLTSIGDIAFSGCTALESFEMPNSVTSIGEEAFSGCSSLATLTLSNQLTEIPYRAFYNCSNLGTDLNIPASVTEIGGTAFWHCTGIQNLTLNNGLQTIDGNAFEGCTGIGSVSIPNTVTTIGDNAFLGCTEVAAISLPPSVTSIGDRAFKDAEANCVLTINSNGGNISLGTLALPNSNFSVHLTGIGFPMQNAATSIFDTNMNLTSVEIESGISTIPNYAFIGCTNLKDVVLPSGITTIKNNAFDNCTKLETINIPATVTQIKDEAFKNAGQNAAHTLTLTFKGHQNNMTECNLPNKTFDVVLEGGVPTKNGVSIFDDAQTLQSVVFKGGQLDVGMAFSSCDSLTTVTFNSYPTVIDTNIFPDDVGGIIFDPYPNNMTNVKNISNLLTSGRNFLTNPLAVTFKNNTTREITINANAFNFSGADNIEYIFEADPNNEKMHYDNGNCFISGTRIEYGGSYYDWDPTSKSWVQE